MSDRDELNQLRSEFNTQATVTPRQELEQLRSEFKQPQAITPTQPLGSIESLQDLHSRQVGGEQITNEQFKAASQGLSQEQQLQAFKAGRETTFDRAVGDVVGGAEGFASMATSIPATIAGGVVGLASLPEGSEVADQRIKATQEALTFQPRTPKGKGALEPVQKLGEKIESGKKFLGRDTTKALEGTPLESISPFLATISHTLPDATLSLLGLKTIGKPTPQQAAQTQAIKQIKQPFSKAMTKSDKAIAQLILDKSDDISTSNVKLSAENLKSKIIDGLPRIMKDKAGINAIKQGISEKATAIIKSSTPLEKANYKAMTGVVDRALKSGTAEALERVGDVVGNTLKRRVVEAVKLNRRAGKNIDPIAKTNLAGKTVETASISDNFNSSLNKLKVNMTDGKMNFKGSNIETDIPSAVSAQKILKLTKQRLNAAGNDAFKLHELKQFIDQQVKFGKTKAGAAGAAEDTLKNLRKEINNVLRQKSKEYAAVNDKFSTTKKALDDFQQAAGTKLDLLGEFAEQGLGNKMRTLTNNSQGRSILLKAMSDLEDVLIKNGFKPKDRIVPQAVIANEMESLFKLDAKTGLPKIMKDAVANKAAGAGDIQTAVSLGRGIKDTLSGKSPDKAIKAIRELLKETK